jgi:hypothetical protein
MMAPAWDIYNSRNPGHAMSRMFTILTEILPGSDPVVAKLVSQLGIDPNKVEIDGMRIPLAQSHRTPLHVSGIGIGWVTGQFQANSGSVV